MVRGAFVLLYHRRELLYFTGGRSWMEVKVLLLSTDLDHPFVELPYIIGDTFLLPMLHKHPQLLQEGIHSLGGGNPISAVLMQDVLPHHIQHFLQMPVIGETVLFMVECQKFDDSFVVPGGTVGYFVLSKLWETPIELRIFCTNEQVEFKRPVAFWAHWLRILSKEGADLIPTIRKMRPAVQRHSPGGGNCGNGPGYTPLVFLLALGWHGDGDGLVVGKEQRWSAWGLCHTVVDVDWNDHLNDWNNHLNLFSVGTSPLWGTSAAWFFNVNAAWGRLGRHLQVWCQASL